MDLSFHLFQMSYLLHNPGTSETRLVEVYNNGKLYNVDTNKAPGQSNPERKSCRERKRFFEFVRVAYAI